MALSNLGLIQMGGAMLRPGGSLGDGFLAYGDGMVRDDHMKSTALFRNAQMQSLQSQAQERQMKILADQQQRENMKKFMESLQAPGGTAPAPVSPQGGLNGPLGSGTIGMDPLAAMAEKGLQTPAQASVAPQGQQGKWDELKVLMGMQAGLKPADIEALANARNLGLPEVARTIEQADALGNPQTLQFDKQGRPVGAPIRKPVTLSMEDFGGHKQFANPHTGAIVGNQFGKTNSPDSILSANTTMRGQNMTDSRSRELAQIQRETNATNRDLARSKFDTETEMKLADDYRAESKDFRQVFPAVGKVKAALPTATKSAASTLAAATSFMKLLDPGSVVRESELGMALAATGAFDRAGNYLNRLQNGQVLTPDQVADFERTVDKVYEAAVQAQAMTDKAFTEKALQYGLRPEAIVSGITSGSKHPPKKAGIGNFDPKERPPLSSFDRK